jgi:hypothetical protein
LSGSSDGREEEYPAAGKTSHYDQVTGGVQFLLSKRFLFSFEVGLNLWNGVTFPGPAPIYESHGSLLGVFLLLSGAIATGPF